MRALLLLPLCLLAGCGDEPDFDERYEAAEQDLHRRAAEIDAELESRKKAAETPATDEARAAPSGQ